MNHRRFDDLSRLVAIGSRRRVLRGLAAALLAAPLLPARRIAARQGVVVLGGECAESGECRQQDMQGQAVCADNGFAADGPLNCCAESGCCMSDADCCGDLRCFAWPDVCNVCLAPPFATRGLGQPCEADDQCIPYPPSVDWAGCINGRCANSAYPDPEPLPISDVEAALIAAEELSELEAMGRFDALYDRLHPDASAVVPRSAVVGWYGADFAPHGPRTAEAIKVRFVPWTWPVTGQSYPETAEVAYRQAFEDGTVVRDEVRLVRDRAGQWGWFFGRDRAFVDEQIARFGAGSVAPSAPLYTVVDLGTGYGNWSRARRINEGGQVLWMWGTSRNPESGLVEDYHQAIWWNGIVIDLSALGVERGIDINDAGFVLGSQQDRGLLYRPDLGLVEPLVGFDRDAWPASINGAGAVTGNVGGRAVISEDGNLTELLPVSGYGFWEPNAINYAGHVVGTARPSRTDETDMRGVVFGDGGGTVLGPAPGATTSSASDLNDIGQLVGYPGRRGMHSVAIRGRAFLYERRTGEMMDLGTLAGYEHSVASAINNVGQIVGYAWGSTAGTPPHRRPFVWNPTDGRMVDLNDLIPTSDRIVLVDAFDINDVGQIVGQATIEGEIHAVLLSPDG